MILAVVVWAALLTAVGLGLARVAGDQDIGPLLLSPGLWFPLALLVAAMVLVWVVRRSYGHHSFWLDGERLVVRPTWLTRLVKGTPEQSLRPGETTVVRLLATRYGTQLALFPGSADDPPVLFPLAHQGTPELLAALGRAETSHWDPAAERARQALEGKPGFGALEDLRPASDPMERAPAYLAAGLWHLAADALWPAVLKHPEDRDLAHLLHAAEHHRLSTVTRLSLMQALLAHHDREPELLMDYARLCLSVKNRVEAQAVLDRLVELDDPPAVGVRWRTVLRERKQVPAPPSKATMGIEVSLPTHHLEGETLIVDGRFKATLDWFIGYRLLTGFWGPARRLQLLDVRGQTHVLLGDPLDWAARLERAAPHLIELHDEGLAWPGTRSRIRRLRRLAPPRD